MGEDMAEVVRQIKSQFLRQLVFLITANVLFSVRYELFVL
jgi:hypothetical protein